MYIDKPEKPGVRMQKQSHAGFSRKWEEGYNIVVNTHKKEANAPSRIGPRELSKDGRSVDPVDPLESAVLLVDI